VTISLNERATNKSIDDAVKIVEDIEKQVFEITRKNISVTSPGKESILRTLVKDFLSVEQNIIEDVVDLVEDEIDKIIRSEGKRKNSKRVLDRVGKLILKGVKARIFGRRTSGRNTTAFARAKKQQEGTRARAPQPTYGIYSGKTVDGLKYNIVESKTK